MNVPTRHRGITDIGQVRLEGERAGLESEYHAEKPCRQKEAPEEHHGQCSLLRHGCLAVGPNAALWAESVRPGPRPDARVATPATRRTRSVFSGFHLEVPSASRR